MGKTKAFYQNYAEGDLAPEVEAFLSSLATDGDDRPLSAMSPGEVRAACNISPWTHRGDREVVSEDLSIPSPGGRLALRLYRPPVPGPLPLLLWFHGGGWVFGSLDEADHLCAALAGRTPCLVASVDYRLAPEAPYPAALEDCGAALAWAFQEASNLGTELGKIAVGGESAGANMAAVLCAQARDRARPMPAFQLLVCPWTNLASLDSPSCRAFGAGPWLPRKNLDYYRSQYLAAGVNPLDPAISPALSPIFRGLPPAHVVTAEFDPLRDDGEAYADRLEAAGVALSRTRYKGMIHSFIVLNRPLPRAEAALDDCAARLSAGFAR